METAAFLVESSPLPKIIEQLPPYYTEIENITIMKIVQLNSLQNDSSIYFCDQ
ncbi:MAG: hypothetical protein MUW51_02090 [Lactococcus lactis]|nr:hypothetical protein [Lactococcus lactis]